MAISANVDGHLLADNPTDIDITRARVNRRCQDLLSVTTDKGNGNGRIEFLHRSVRDFLQQSKSVSEKLERLAGHGFDAERTLLACYVFLIKSADRSKNTRMWSTQALLHLGKIGGGYDTSAAQLLQELDRVMQLVTCGGPNHAHWSNYIYGTYREVLETEEGGVRDLIGHLIEFNLLEPVKATIQTNPSAKRGRPYLDYALRYNPKGSHRVILCDELSQLSGCPAMVEMLLGVGCDVNEPVLMYSGRTVWDLYLKFLSDRRIGDRRRCETTWLLINHGARPIKACVVGQPPDQKELSMKAILSGAFGLQEAENMCERISKNEVSKDDVSQVEISKDEVGQGTWSFWPFSWKPQLSNTAL